jgi:hypothetical protein
MRKCFTCGLGEVGIWCELKIVVSSTMVSVSVLGQFSHPEDKKETQWDIYKGFFWGKKRPKKSPHHGKKNFIEYIIFKQ